MNTYKNEKTGAMIEVPSEIDAPDWKIVAGGAGKSEKKTKGKTKEEHMDEPPADEPPVEGGA